MNEVTQSEFVWRPFRKEIMTLLAIKANQDAVRQMIKTDKGRLKQATNAAEKNVPVASVSRRSDDDICFACAEPIPSHAHVCRYCRTIQPKSIRKVVSLQLYIFGQIEEQEYLRNVISSDTYAAAGGAV